MRREVKRDRKLPAFQLDLQQFGLLWEKGLSLFDPSAEITSTLTIQQDSEELIFNTFQELIAYKDLPARFAKFTLRISQLGNRLTLYVDPSVISPATSISATSSSEMWCAGAVDQIYTFIFNHKAPMRWLIDAPLGWIATILVYGVFLLDIIANAMNVLPKTIPKPMLYAWLSLVIAVVAIYGVRNRSLTKGLVIVRETRPFYIRYSTELTLLMAAISVIVSIVGLFVQK